MPTTSMIQRFEIVNEPIGWKVILGWKVKKEYLQKLEIINVSVDRGEFGMIKGEIRNNGDKTLTEITANVTYLGADDKPIFEQEAFLMTDFDKALLPGYIKKFSILTDEAPSAWGGKVNIKVVDIELKK